jgi:hypothetical protein
MSTRNKADGPSTDNFTAIFNAASTEYERVTKKCLDTHPFTEQLETCDCAEAISSIFRTQAQAFSNFRKGDEKLMVWLDPIINILFLFSGTLGAGIGLVSRLFCLIMNLYRHLVLSHFHPRKQSLPASVFFSGKVSSQLPSRTSE